MISNTKPQNVIVVVTLILGIVSGIGLANSASYFSGSYVIVRYLEVDLTNVRVTNATSTQQMKPLIQHFSWTSTSWHLMHQMEKLL
ncbi:MAG: hypothetical protein ACXABD_17405 [Candidatus Thorarchaeota archaeon]|jgi:hypothetical protein